MRSACFARARFGAIVLLGLVLMAIFVLWMVVAAAIYKVTLGPEPPASIGSFLHDVFTTGAGWAMIVLGVGIGFLFAVLVLSISVVSFPFFDRNVGVEKAVWTSSPGGHDQPSPDGVMGTNRRGRAGDRVDTRVCGPDHRPTRARVRHLASLSQGGTGAESGACFGLPEHGPGTARFRSARVRPVVQ